MIAYIRSPTLGRIDIAPLFLAITTAVIIVVLGCAKGLESAVPSATFSQAIVGTEAEELARVAFVRAVGDLEEQLQLAVSQGVVPADARTRGVRGG